MQQKPFLLTSTLVALFVQTPVIKHRYDLCGCSNQQQHLKHVKGDEISFFPMITEHFLISSPGLSFAKSINMCFFKFYFKLLC